MEVVSSPPVAKGLKDLVKIDYSSFILYGYFVSQETLRSNDIVENMLPYMSVDGTKRIVEQEDVGVVINRTSQTNSLLFVRRTS